MENYTELGTKYLSRNKKRSLITVIGCFIVASGLFMLLNSLVCWVEKCRIDARADDDCEIVILTDDKDIIEAIVNEDFVTSAYLGKAFSWVDESDDNYEIYANALHINVREKFLINHYSKYIEKTYGVETELNDLLAWTYCQDNDGVGYIMILSGLLISFIIAIIGVGVLRNNISISAMERVKDYGNLRCIGATKKQIRNIVYRESLYLETVGIVAGILMGFLLSIPLCNKRQYPVGFHILPVIFLLIAFYGDMYFAVGDGLKKVLKVSPVEAVRGTYRIKAKGVKRRHSGIWGLLFGVEGDYAYKNIKRNNGRFIKTILAMTFGMGVVIVVGGCLGALFNEYRTVNSIYGYYQQYIVRDTNNIDSYEEHKADLYSPKALKKISSAKGIEDPKYIYQSTLYTAEDHWVFKHINEKYYTDTYEASLMYGKGDLGWDEVHHEAGLDESLWESAEKNRQDKKNARKAYRDSGKGLVDYENKEPYDEERHKYEIDMTENLNLYDGRLDIFGYDEEDYARYKDRLIDGTVDLSENGILLVNQSKIMPADAYINESLINTLQSYQFLDVKVGDEITVVDPAELYQLCQEERKNADAYDTLMKEKADEWEREHKDEVDDNGEKLSNPYEDYSEIRGNQRKEAWIINSAREKLVDEDRCKTFVVEGIIANDPNSRTDAPTIVVPLNRFYDITGKTENDFNGMKFHVSNIFSSDFEKDDFINALDEKQNIYYEGIEDDGPTYLSYTSVYLEGITYMVSAVKVMLAIAAVIFVIIIVSLLNTMNVTISGLQTRRNEFAQLRSLGMTKRSLLKAVLLEGGIVWIISTILGIVVGIGVEYLVYKVLVDIIIDAKMYIFWPGIIIAALLSLAILCGSNYFFFNQMKLNVAEELTRSGE